LQQIQPGQHAAKARIGTKTIHSGLHIAEQKEGLAITVRFLQTSKRPVSFTKQTIKYRNLCRSAFIAALQLLQISQRISRSVCLPSHSVSLRQTPKTMHCVAEDFDQLLRQRDALFELSLHPSRDRKRLQRLRERRLNIEQP